MSLIGASVRRSDGDGKVRGSAVYGMDYSEPHALVGKILRSTVAAARLLRIDVSGAEAMPGVHAVASSPDATGLSGMFGAVADQAVFARDFIRYVGEPLAAVAAESEEQAMAALAAIVVEYEALEPVLTVEEALADGAREIHPGWADYATVMPAVRGGNLTWQASTERGDVDAAFADAHLVVEGEYRSSRQHQSSIEPHAAVARFEQGRYVVHTPTQFPFNVRSRIAALLGVRESDVRVVVQTIGGGFGGKLDAVLEPFACILAKKSGRTVRVLNSREEEYATCGPRENGYVRLRTAVDASGRILAQEGLIIADNGANSSGETVGCANVAPLALGSTYNIPTARYVSQVVYTNTPPTAAYRGVNGPYNIFAQEMHLEEVALQLGMDRLEFKRKNVLRRGEHAVNEQPHPDAFLLEALDAAEDLRPWRAMQEHKAGGPYRGFAVVPVTWLTNPGPAGATVRLSEDGRVIITSAGAEIGTGSITTGIRQIVGEELGVPIDDVIITEADTDAGAFDNGAQGSRTTFGLGNAVLDAAQKVRAMILETAAGLLEAAAADLELIDGEVRLKGVPARAVPMATVAGSAMWSSGPIVASGRFAAPAHEFDAACMSGAMFSAFNAATYHAHYAEVEVDPDTGEVEVLSYGVAQDVGRAINPQMLEGQIHGAVAQGLGYALWEELRVKDGSVVEKGFETYRVPTALDVPKIDIAILENPCAYGPLGAKGAAEPPIVPVAAVIGCAVANAIGVAITELPITPFKVLAALQSSH